MGTGAGAADPTRDLVAFAARLTEHGAPAAAAAGIGAADLRWAAARRTVAAAVAAHCAAQGMPFAGALASPPCGARAAALETALRCVPAPAAPPPPPPSLQWLGAAYPRLLLPGAQKRTGSWFTAPGLAGPTVQRTLAPLHGEAAAAGRTLRIVDPAVGAGAFLLAALAERVAAGRRAADVAAHELFGLDLDPTAAALAALALHEACGADAPPLGAIEANVRCGDGLLELDDGAFDAVVGNPPWETLQSSRRDDADVAERRELQQRVAALRARFLHRGRGKLYTYRLFVERALRLLRRGGRLGLLVPGSLWFDRDAAPLRQQLLGQCSWEWLFAFENNRRLFAIDGRYRFGVIVAQTGARTAAVRAAFGAADPRAWQSRSPRHLAYRARDVAVLSPHSGAFVEVQDDADLDLLRRLAAAGRPLLGAAGLCDWRQGDFNMTADRARFRRRDACERQGFAPVADGTWRRGNGDPVLRPLWQGGMIGLLHPNAGAYAGGTGRAVRWRPPHRDEVPAPMYLVDAADAGHILPGRTALRALTNATNERTAIACLLADEPCGNSLGVLTARAGAATPLRDAAFVAGVLASLVFDWSLRQRLGGTNVNGFVLADVVVPEATAAAQRAIAQAALQLCAVLPWHGVLWDRAAAEGWRPAPAGPDRMAVRVRLELAVAASFGLLTADLEWMLRDCEHSAAALADRAFVRGLDRKGFWRVDRELAPASRLPVRVLAAARRARNAQPARSDERWSQSDR